MRVSVFRKAHFNAAHRLHNPNWSDEKNAKIYGPCNNPYFHGHNYEVTVKVTGEVNPDTGYVIDLSELKSIIKEEVEDHLDHKNLNLQVPEFKDMIPSAEYICYVIWNRLRKRISDQLDLQVRLYETPRNFVEYPA